MLLYYLVKGLACDNNKIFLKLQLLSNNLHLCGVNAITCIDWCNCVGRTLCAYFFVSY